MTYPSNSESVAQDQIRAFVERIERMDEELKAINDDKKEIYAEAKGNGFDIPALKQVIKIRRQDHAERMEREAIVDLYMSALGMQAAPRDDDEYGTTIALTRAPAREIEHEPGIEPAGGEVALPPAEPIPAVAGDQSEADAPEVRGMLASATRFPGAASDTANSNVTAFEPKPFRPWCLNREVCAGQGRVHCHRCTAAHEAAPVEIEHHGSVA